MNEASDKRIVDFCYCACSDDLFSNESEVDESICAGP